MPENQSMADSIRSAMKEVREAEPAPVEQETVQEEAPREEAPETVEQTADRTRDQSGRFAKPEQAGDKARETLTLKKPNAATQQERAPQAKDQAQAAPAKPVGANGASKEVGQPATVAPPQHWNGAAKIDWNKIPATLRESIAKDYEQVGKAQALTTVLAPMEQVFTREFGGTDRALASILGTWQHARTNPVDFLRQFMQHYRIDPQSLGAVGPQAQGQEQDADPYAPRFQRIETALQQIAQQPVIHQQNQIQSNIQSFQTAQLPDGSVAHPYFNDVRTDMGILMQSPRMLEVINSKGEQAALKEAYDQACWANPTVRNAMLSEQRRTEETDRKQAIERAQSAAVSVSGAPGVNGNHAQAAQSVSDTLRAAYRAARGNRA